MSICEGGASPIHPLNGDCMDNSCTELSQHDCTCQCISMSDTSRGDQSIGDPTYGFEELERLNLETEAIKRFLDNNDQPIPDTTDREEFLREVGDRLSRDLIDELVKQYKYAGQQTIHYFRLPSIDEHEFDFIVEKVLEEFPNRNEVEGLRREPFFAEEETIDNRLYLTFGYFKSSGERDIRYGSRKPSLITKRCVVVIRKTSGLVEVRTSDGNIAEDTLKQLAASLGFKNYSISRPDFGEDFATQFNGKVNKYTNLKVQVEEQEGSTIDVISFTSREDESGERKDARDDERVKEELDRDGSEITMGYVEVDTGHRFHVNRKQSKISVRRVEREERLTNLTELIDDILEEAGEYPQSTLRGIEDVPE